jgi:hypothetical protein
MSLYDDVPSVDKELNGMLGVSVFFAVLAVACVGFAFFPLPL